jgi:hypothetical protein
MTPRRLGRFTIKDFGDPDAVRAIFGSCLIFNAEYSLMHQGYEYVADSGHFDEVEQPCRNDLIPEYEWKVEPQGHGRFYIHAQRTRPDAPPVECPNCEKLKQAFHGNPLLRSIQTLATLVAEPPK